MSNVTVSGVVRKVGEVETVGTNNFRKRLIVLDDNSGQYPAVYAVEFVQDKTDLLNGIFEGSNVEINVNIRCNEVGDRFFTSLQGWKINVK